MLNIVLLISLADISVHHYSYFQPNIKKSRIVQKQDEVGLLIILQAETEHCSVTDRKTDRQKAHNDDVYEAG